MAERTPRWLPYNENLWLMSGSVLEALSQDTGLAVGNLRDEVPSRVVRSAAGFTFRPRFNAAWDFEEGTTLRTAFLSRSTFANPTLAAAELASALNAAGASPFEYTPTAWWRAEDIVNLADGAGVQTWPDASGNNRSLSQATSNLRPTLALRTVNGRPSVRFDGTGQRMATSVNLSALLGASGVGTVFVVYWVDNDTTLDDWLWNAGSTGHLAISGNLSARNQDSGGVDAVSKAHTLGAWHVAVWMHDATTLFSGVDDGDTADLASVASGATVAGDLGVPLNLGATSGGASPLKGYVAEVCVFNSALSETTRRQLMRYWEKKYSGAWTNGSTAPTWTNTYTASHDGTRFTVARSAGAATFSQRFLTGKHALESAALDYGFSPAADLTGATSYAAPNAAYQSRQLLLCRRPAAAGALAAYLVKHNLGSGGSVTVFGDASRDGWYSPSFSQALAGDDLARIRIAFFASLQTFAQWGLILNNVDGADGYTEVGHAFTGVYGEPARGIERGEVEQAVPLSVYARSEGGAIFGRPRNAPRSRAFTFHRLSRADKEAYQTMEDASAGHHVAFAMDPQNYPGKDTRYGVIASPARITQFVGDGSPPDRYDVAVPFEEDLG